MNIGSCKRVIRAAVEDLRCRARLKLPCWIIFLFFHSFSVSFSFRQKLIFENLFTLEQRVNTHSCWIRLRAVHKSRRISDLKILQSWNLQIIHMLRNNVTSYVKNPQRKRIAISVCSVAVVAVPIFLCGENIKFRKW